MQQTTAEPTDTMPAGMLGMWLFLASEGMFFLAILSAFIVLQSTGGQHQLFVHSSQMLSKPIGIASVLWLILSSAAMLKKRKLFYWIAVGGAGLFLVMQCVQCSRLLDQETVVYRWGDKLFVADGDKKAGVRLIRQPAKFDIHTVTASDFASAPLESNAISYGDEIKLRWNYGPSRNNFFATYFLMTVWHCVHLMAGLLALLWFLIFRRARVPAAVQIYWHFINAVGVIGVGALYWV